MPLYQIATDEGTLEVDHSGPLEDLTPAVELWVADKRDARLSAESSAFREGVTPVTTGERIKDFAKGLPEQLSKSFIPEETIKKANVTAETAPAVATALTGGVSDFVRGIVGKEKFDSFAAGAINKAEDVAAGFVSPLGIGLLGLGALPKAIQKAAALGFTADIISHAPEKAHAIANAKTPEELGSAITDAVATAGMAVGAGVHGFKGGIKENFLTKESWKTAWKPQEVTTKVNETLSEVAQAEPPTFTKLSDIPPSAETQPGGAVPPTTAEVGALPAELKGGEPNATQERVQQSRDQLQYQGTDAQREASSEAGNRNQPTESRQIEQGTLNQPLEFRKGDAGSTLGSLSNAGMKPVVRELVQDTEILQSVVPLLPVDVVNNLGLGKLSAQERLNQVNMLLDRPAVSGQHDVGGSVASTLAEGITSLRAEFLSRLAARDYKGAAALFTGIPSSRSLSALVSFRPRANTSTDIPAQLSQALARARSSGEFPIGTNVENIAADFTRELNLLHTGKISNRAAGTQGEISYSNKRDKVYSGLMQKAKPVGPGLFEIDEKSLPLSVRRKLLSDRDIQRGTPGARPEETDNFSLRHKSEVTGIPQDRGWILKDKNYNRNRDARSGNVPPEAEVATAEPTTARAETAPTPPPANTPTEGVPVEGVGPASVQPTGKLSAAQLNEKIDALLSRHQAEKDPAVQSQLFAEAKGLMEQLKTAEGESMGPGAASAEEDLGRRIVSMKNAAVDQARQERGLEPLMSEAKRTFGESWDMAQEVIAKDEAAPSKLVDDLNSGKKTSINEVEQDLLLHEEIKLRNDRDMELERASDEFATAEERDAAAARVTALEDRLNQTEQANRRAGTYSGRALSIRRQMMYDDYTPAALERRLRAAKGGESLSAEEIASAKADSEKITEALRKSEERVAQLEKEARDKAAEDALRQDLGEASIDQRVLDYSRKIVRKWENEAKPAMDRLRQRYAVLRITPPEPNLASDLRDLTLVARAFIGKNGLKAAEFSAEMVKEFGNAIEPLIDEAWKAANEQLNKLGKELPPRKKKAVVKAVKGQAGTDAERQAIISGITEAAKEGPLTDQATEKYVKLLFRNFIDSGMRGLDKITDAVHAIIEPNVPGITKDQIRDAYSDYGKTKAAPTEPNKVYASQLRGEAQKVSQLKDILEKQQAPKPTGQQRVPPADVTRRLQKLINEAKKKYNIQPADPAKALKSALDSRKTYYRNKLSDLRYEIAKQEKLVRDKVSPPTDPELEAIKKEYEQVKAEHDEIFGKPELTDKQKLERAIKVAERAEQNARRTLEDARKGVFPGKKPAGPTSPQLEAIKARVEAFRQEAKELLEMSDSFKQEAEQKKIQATEKQIAELDRKLREGDLATKPKTAEAAGELGRLQAERAALVKELARQRRELLPKRSPEEIALQSYAARLAREQADLLDRLSRADAGDVTAFERRKPQKLDISKDPEVVKRKAVVEQLKQDLLKKEHEYRLAHRKVGERIKDAIIQTFHAGKNIVSAFDFSAPRQGAFAIAGHPVKGLKALIPMFKGWASEAKAREQEARIHNRPNALAGVDKMAKVEYTPLDETKFTKAEENARSVLDDWAQLPLKTGNAAKSIATAPVKLVSKGVRMSNRAFITFLNTIRADLLDSLLEANFKDRAPTQAELEAIGNFVNVATGRGKLNPKVASVASGFIWAPKLLTSRIQTLAGQPFYRGTARTRVIMAKEYARVLVSGYLLWKTSQLFTDKNEQDPRSSDFGKIKIGNIRIDPWGGFQQVSVLASRLATRETKSAKSGKITSLTEPKFGQPDVTDVLKNFIRTKLSPPVGTVIDLLNKKNVVGQKVGVKEAVQNLSIPLSFRDIYKIMKQEGLPTAVIIQILSTFGAGVAVYDDEEKVNRQ